MKHAWRRVAVVAAVLVACVLVGLVLIVLSILPEHHTKTLECFRMKMKSEADIPAIRAWCKSYSFSSGEEQERVPRAQWPDCIGELRPHYVFFDHKNRVAWISYRVGQYAPFTLGLMVGPPGAKPQDFPRGSHSTVQIEEGVWVWDKE